MKKFFFISLMCMMTLLPQFVQAETYEYGGAVVDNIDEYVFSDSRVNYYIHRIVVYRETYFTVYLVQELINPNDIVTKGSVYGTFIFSYNYPYANEWGYRAYSAADVEIYPVPDGILEAVRDTALPYVENSVAIRNKR